MTIAKNCNIEKPSIKAAALLLAGKVVGSLGGDWAYSVSDILEMTGAGKSQAYAMLPRVEQAVAAVPGQPGRPVDPESSDQTVPVTHAVADYLMDNPGAVSGKGSRRWYSDGFRRLVIGLNGPGGPTEGLTLEQYARAVRVPPGTLKDWLTIPVHKTEEPGSTAEPDSDAEKPPSGADEADYAGHADVATIICEWKRWQGGFAAFCTHLRDDLRIGYGRTFIGTLLHALGLRRPSLRNSGAAPWSRGTFRRLFPGAQWLGDGTTVAINLNGHWEVFNIEAVVDVDSDAVLGVEVSDVEDQAAVLAAYESALETADGKPPLGLTLDNKPCNHTDPVEATIKPAVLLPATPARGEAKAAVEQKFSLFSQTAPPLQVRGNTRRELASSVLALVFTCWAWTANGKPRNRLAGKTPAGYYLDTTPTPEQIVAGHEWVQELHRRYLKFKQTRERRADPVRRRILAQALQDLGILDENHRLEIALAIYSTDAIIEGLAVFQSKTDLGTLPPDAQPGRYLGGIIRHRNDYLELMKKAFHVLDLRLRHKDLSLAPLQARLQSLKAKLQPEELPQRLIDIALEAGPEIDFHFYSKAACEALRGLPHDYTLGIYPHLARSIAAAFATEKQRRHDLIAWLAKAVTDTAP